MGDMRNSYKILVRKPLGRDHERNLGVDERTALKIKKKLKLWVCLTKHHTMKISGEVERQLHALLHLRISKR
jgi:hypothetical protein